MRKWSVFVVLVVIALVMLTVGELLQEGGQGGAEPKTVRLATHTSTVTRTVGWWDAVATWTPTPTGQVTEALPSITPLASGTPIPFWPTLEIPTPRPTWTEGTR